MLYTDFSTVSEIIIIIYNYLKTNISPEEDSNTVQELIAHNL